MLRGNRDRFITAWAGLCGSLNVLPWYLPESRKREIPQVQRDAESACNRAIALAPDLASPHIMLGNLYTNEWRWKEAEPHFQRAQALAPNDPEFYFAYTDWLGTQGRVHMLLAAHSLNKIEKVYGTVFENILGEKISTKPVEVVTPFPWVQGGRAAKGG